MKQKEFRIDSFSGKTDKKFYFDSESEAVLYGKKLSNNGKIVFLLKHLIDGKYDVVKEIK